MEASVVLFLVFLCFGNSSGAGILKMFHMSDTHQDNEYSVKGHPGEGRCHENGTVPGDLSPAGNYACDSPPILVDSSLKYMQKVNPNPDVLIWSGN